MKTKTKNAGKQSAYYAKAPAWYTFEGHIEREWEKERYVERERQWVSLRFLFWKQETKANRCNGKQRILRKNRIKNVYTLLSTCYE